MAKKQLFVINFIYFKNSGKFYSRGTAGVWADNCGTEERPICYMQDVVDWVQEQRFESATFPGLSGTWREYITIDCEDGYPCLIMPI